MTRNETESRRRAWALGSAAEGWAAWALRLKGFRILARRWKTPVGEIDLVARRGRLLAFVEVKARADYATAVHSLTRHQRRRIEKAAGAFITLNPFLAGCDQRFDLMILRPWRLPIHLADAWRPES